MLKIKISVGWNMPFKGASGQDKQLSIFNFTNTKDNIYNNKKYYLNAEVEEPDYWFIIENTDSRQIEKVRIDKKNIIFLGSETRYEPSYFLLDSKKEFLSQFNVIYSPNYLNLENSINEPAFLNWKLRGDPFEINYKESDIKFYEKFQPEKNNLLSVYCTGKQINEVHKVRLDFVKKLKSIFGDDLHWYGDEIKTKDKIEGIGSYKYHLVLENQLGHNSMTEKLFDSYLGNSYPIYAGATNTEDYFPNNSFTKINLNDFNGSVNTIKECISNKYYEENYDELITAKNVVLEKFNLIKRIDNIIEERLAQSDTKNLQTEISIYPKFHYEGKNKISRFLFALNKRIKRLANYLEKFYS
mgnify:FL=1|tara:strand:- start:9340 stop:10407 length:1068 start_codon:yes stop_codon:yes gene_type:complete